jgi:gluconokinase
MKVPGLRSPHDKVGGIVYFGRMLDKIRLKARGALPQDYNTGTKEWYDFDSRCTRFLRVPYSRLRAKTLAGGTDLGILRWCLRRGRRPGREQIEIWNTFMRKRGWADGSSKALRQAKRMCGLHRRKSIVTWFDLFDADERRPRRRRIAKRGP